MARWRNKKSGEIIEGLRVTGDQNDLVGLVVWAEMNEVFFNQVAKKVLGGGIVYLPRFLDAAPEDALPVGTLVEIPASGISRIWSPDFLSENYEEVHDG